MSLDKDQFLLNKEQNSLTTPQDPTIHAQYIAQDGFNEDSNEEWYDQGFDLGEDDNSSFADYGINTSILNTASSQLEASNRNNLRSKADENKNYIMVGGEGPLRGLNQARDIGYVGGEGPLRDHNVNRYYGGEGLASEENSIYSPQYLSERKKQLNKEHNLFNNKEINDDDSGDYSTYVVHKKNQGIVSYADAQFRKSVDAKDQAQQALYEQELINKERNFQQQELYNRQNNLKLAQEKEHDRARRLRQERVLAQQKAYTLAKEQAVQKRAQLQAQRAAQLNEQANRQQEKIMAKAQQQSKVAMQRQMQQSSQQELIKQRVEQAKALMAAESSAMTLASGNHNAIDRGGKSSNIVDSKELALRNSADSGPYGSQARGPQRRSNVEHINNGPQVNEARPNSEKSLEELAAEFPNMAPKNLIKLKRSSNRCHLVARTPIFDASSKISMYELKFTAGKVFQVNSLKSQHVFHVLFGYFIRRGLSCFIGRTTSAFVMMPLTYDFLDYIENYSVSRVVLRICPEQPVTPSALHILTKLRRAGMSFAIDLMLLLKKDWSKAVLSIEYVMIDLSQKVNEQLQLFSRIKSKAPWLKTIGYNDVDGSASVYLARKQIDLYNGVYWQQDIRFLQDSDSFTAMRQQFIALISELFSDEPNYVLFLRFLRNNENFTRDAAVFLYRFRHASPRQVQNVEDLYQYLLNSGANRSFAVLAGRAIMLTYVKAADFSSQNILQAHYTQALVRGYFLEYMAKIFDDEFLRQYAFQAGMYSLLHLFLQEEEVDLIANDNFAHIYDRIYGESELLADIIDCIIAIENTDLSGIFAFIQKHKVPPASVLISHEKALMRTNELLLVLNIVTNRK